MQKKKKKKSREVTTYGKSWSSSAILNYVLRSYRCDKNYDISLSIYKFQFILEFVSYKVNLKKFSYGYRFFELSILQVMDFRNAIELEKDIIHTHTYIYK